MSAPEPQEEPRRHFWLPVSDRVRHAFRGRRYGGQDVGTTVCGIGVTMGEATETDWVMAPSCLECNRILKEEQGQ